MADIREMLARLNPQTVKFDTGRGGVAELTNQDIAAALAFVPAGLGREVLTACWWPDGGDRRRVLDGVLTAVSVEWRRQAERMAEARTELGIAEACAGWSSTPATLREVARARARYERVRDECWPKEMGAMLPPIVQACLEQIAKRHQCPACEGRGERQRGELRVRCEKCGGTGIVSVSESHRARLLDRHVETFRRHWARPYGWVLSLMIEREQEAAAQLRRALQAEAA